MKAHQFKWQLANLAGRCTGAVMARHAKIVDNGWDIIPITQVADESVEMAKLILAKCERVPVPAFVPDPADATLPPQFRGVVEWVADGNYQVAISRASNMGTRETALLPFKEWFGGNCSPGDVVDLVATKRVVVK